MNEENEMSISTLRICRLSCVVPKLSNTMFPSSSISLNSSSPPSPSSPSPSSPPSSVSSLSILKSCSLLLEDLNHLIFPSSSPPSLLPLYQQLNTTILSLLQKHLFSLNYSLYQSPIPSLSSTALPLPSTSTENLLNEYHKEITFSLSYLKGIVGDIRQQRPNHFGVFEVSPDPTPTPHVCFHSRRNICTSQRFS
jgi:hypothetical protein